MRISDWSSDVCSSDLAAAARAKEDGATHKTPPPPIEVAKTAPIKVGGLGWPVSGTLVAGYGAPMPDGSKSAGVLIGAPAGTTVPAVADGTVVFSEWMTGYGLILLLRSAKLRAGIEWVSTVRSQG